MKADVKMTDVKKIKEKARSKSSIYQNMAAFLGLVFVLVLFAIMTDGNSIALRNLKLIFMQSILLMIGSIGAAFTLSHGSLDFSLGGILGMSAMFGGLASLIHPALMLPAAMTAAILAELFNIGVALALKIPSFVASFAMMFISKGLLVAITQSVQVNMPSAYSSWDTPIVYLAFFMGALILGFILFEYTKIGKFNKAIGSNYTAAATSGIQVNKFKVLAFMICGATLGLSAFLNMLRAGGVSATTGSGFEINVLIALVLGGVSLTGGTKIRLRSAITGCLLLTVLENGLVMVGVQPTMVGLIKGVIFFASVTMSYDRKSVQFIT